MHEFLAVFEHVNESVFESINSLKHQLDIIFKGKYQLKIEFNNENLEMVMKKLARWYDFEYTFENAQTKEYHFTARFDREDNISNILKMLELTTDVKFKLENNTIVIL